MRSIAILLTSSENRLKLKLKIIRDVKSFCCCDQLQLAFDYKNDFECSYKIVQKFHQFYTSQRGAYFKIMFVFTSVQYHVLVLVQHLVSAENVCIYIYQPTNKTRLILQSIQRVQTPPRITMLAQPSIQNKRIAHRK